MSVPGAIGALTVLAALLLALICASPAEARKRTYFGVDASAVGTLHAGTGARKAARYASRMGARFERVDISWKRVQSERGAAMNWRKPDREIAAMRRHRVRPLIMLKDAPAWAHPAFKCGTTHCPPDGKHLDDWATFVRAVAERYWRKRPVAIEVWNSPNQWGWWSTRKLGGGPDPARYASVWSWAADQVHHVARSHRVRIPVLFGSIGLNRKGTKDMAIGTFLRGFYEHVNRRVLKPRDGLAVHAYPSKKDLVTGMRARFLKAINQARDGRNAGDPRGARRKLWITEVGMSTTWPNQAERFTQEQQAVGLVGAARKARRMRDVRGVTMYTLIEPKYDPSRPQEFGYGILRRHEDTLVPKLAYCALAAMRHRHPRGC